MVPRAATCVREGQAMRLPFFADGDSGVELADALALICCCTVRAAV